MVKKKYKFYKNKKTRNHPSIQIDANNEVWENMEVTSSPTEKNRYLELKKNPNPKRSSKAFVRKYIRKVQFIRRRFRRDRRVCFEQQK